MGSHKAVCWPSSPFLDWKNMRCPCDISDGQAAAAGMGIPVQNAPSSDGEGQSWALLGPGEVRGIQNCRQSEPPKERENWKTEN